MVALMARATYTSTWIHIFNVHALQQVVLVGNIKWIYIYLYTISVQRDSE